MNKKSSSKIKNIIYLWIPKTAGYSLYNLLMKEGCIRDAWKTPLKNKYNGGIITYGHISFPSLLKKGIINRENFDKSFKLCFVRNPWDRLVSLYFYLRKIKRPEILDCPTFTDFCKKLKKKIDPIGFYNFKGLSQCNPQVNWLVDNNEKSLMNFIGKFENLKEDLNSLRKILGIRGKLKHLNKTTHKNYREYYTKETKEIVRKLYKEDIKMFNYKF